MATGRFGSAARGVSLVALVLAVLVGPVAEASADAANKNTRTDNVDDTGRQVSPAARSKLLRASDLKNKVRETAAEKRRKAREAKKAEERGGSGGSASGRSGSGGSGGADQAAGGSDASGGGPWGSVKDVTEMAVGIEYKKPRRGTRFSFNLVDADLIELIKIIGNITGKSFILGGKVPNIKATIYAPTQITAAEAYQAFLSVLQVNGLTVIPAGRYLKVLPVGGATTQNTRIISKGGVPGRDEIVTRLHRLEHVSAEELGGLLDRFKSADGDITVYAPTNTLIITDYGTSIKRLIRLVSLLDVPGTGEKIWIEMINYADAQELADKIMEIFEVDSSAAATTTKTRRKKSKKRRRNAKAKPAGASSFGKSDDATKISKIIADERTNSLIILASETSYLRILELIKILDVQIAGEGTLHVHKLQHADAEELAKTLGNLSRRSGSSSRGKKGSKSSGGEAAALFEGELQISADKSTNSLVIVSSLRDYLALRTVIDTLDTIQRQVFVEAVIMEVSLDKNRDVGLGLHGGNVVGSGDNQSLVYGSTQPDGSNANSFTQVLSIPALSGLAAGISGPELEGSEDLVGVSVPAFGVALHALQTNSDVNVLSTPNILATDNVEATIQVGENVPVQQGFNGSSLLSGLAGRSGTSATNSGLSSAAGLMGGYGMFGGMMGGIGRQNVGITLKVTPHINDDNQVRLEIDLEISEVKSIDPVTGPTISKQNAVTTSVVGDQQTIVIGGLITDNQVETTTKVPVLGDIPLIGVLFRKKSSLTKKRNLLIFLTPYIIRSSEDFKDIFKRKMAERREFIERYTAFEYHRYDPHLDWGRTNGAIAVVNEVITRAEEDEELRAMSLGEADVVHTPKDPIEFPRGTRFSEDGEDDGEDFEDDSPTPPRPRPARLSSPVRTFSASADGGDDQ